MQIGLSTKKLIPILLNFINSMKFFIVLLFFYFAISTQLSCTKESYHTVSADSTIVAKIFQPSEYDGKDAIIESFMPDQNFGDLANLNLFSWTNNGNITTSRILIGFDFSEISTNTSIDSAKLSLFWSTYNDLSQHVGDNSFTIYKIWQPWDEQTVTWNNQPLTSDLQKVEVSRSYSSDYSFTNIDVTDLVQDMIKKPNENHGFMLKLNEEFPYKLVIVASSDHSDENKRPKLIVYY
jgi:hypothetical protein